MELLTKPNSPGAVVGQMIGCGRFFTSAFLFNLPPQAARQQQIQISQDTIQEQSANKTSPSKTKTANDEDAPVTKHTTRKSKSKRVGKHSDDNKAILMQWLIYHKDLPYATKADRQYLMQQTGLSEQQIKTWLTNARIRHRNIIGCVPHQPAKKTKPNQLVARLKTDYFVLPAVSQEVMENQK